MKKSLSMVLFALLVPAGCASTMPMDGGLMDDHATTLTKCGVGNYTFRFLMESCGATTRD